MDDHRCVVSLQERESRLGQRACVIWLTGLPASGKTTLARAVERRAFDLGIFTCHLDGDDVRQGLSSDLGFTAEDRHENVRRVGEVARLLCQAGIVTIVSMVSPNAADRASVRRLFLQGQFVEVFVDCPLAICEQRDPKGLYSAARVGKLPGLTGIGAPYEAPSAPEVTVYTAESPVASCVARIMDWVMPRWSWTRPACEGTAEGT